MVASVRRPAAQKQRAVEPATAPEADLATARKIVLDLLAIPGVSGDEKAVAERIVKWLVDAGCPASAISYDAAHTKTPVKGNVGNLIVQLPGSLRHRATSRSARPPPSRRRKPRESPAGRG